MAYSEKYYHEYCDKGGNVYRISLREMNYSGSPKEVEGGHLPWVLTQDNPTNLKIGGIYPTRASATFISETGFTLKELYTSDENTYQLVRLKNGLLDWVGYVIPDGFRESGYDLEKPTLEVYASDKLPSLKSIPFVDELGDNYGDDDTHFHTFLWVLKESFKKTGSLLPIWTLVDIKPTLQSNERAIAVKAVVNPLINRVTIIDYRRTIKDELSIGDHIKIEVFEFKIDDFTVEYYPTYDSILITPDIILEGSIFNGDTTMFVSESQTEIEINDPLLTDHDVRVWINDSNVEGKTYFEARGVAMMTWEVVDAIARQFNVRVQQNQGRWEVKRWNVDKIDSGKYEWFVYNSEGVPIGREYFGQDIYIPCVSTENEYRIFGSTREMDRVLKNVIVNYRFKYKQDGDSLQNLILNGNFDGDLNPYPKNWDKVDVVKPEFASGIPQMQINKVTNGLPSDFNSAIQISNYTDFRTLNNLTPASNPQVNAGDRMILTWYEKIDGITGNNINDSYAGIYAISIYETLEHALGASRSGGTKNLGRSLGKVYDLVNNGERNTGSIPDEPTPVKSKYIGRWRDQQEDQDGNRSNYQHYRFSTPYNVPFTAAEYGRWRRIEVEVGEIPINGFLKFEIIGAARNKYVWSASDIRVSGILSAPVYSPNGSRIGDILSGTYEQSRKSYFKQSDGVSIIVTGIFAGKLIDPDNESVPQIDPFMYPDYQSQLSRRYTDTISDIEVLTGDDYGEYAADRISGMWWNGQRTSMWDTWDNRFGLSRQGLITAKSVMEMYWKPTKLFQCEIHAPNINWSSRFEFEEMPGFRFAILRGSINSYDDYFTGTLTEVHDEAAPNLPPGGNDGGNTVIPNWRQSGVQRCVRDSDGLNTGIVEVVEVDINPASPTYGQERWVDVGQNTDICPIGDPIDLFWGASTLPIDASTLEYFPYEKDGNDYLVRFDNDGTGKYLVFLHRASLGTVTSIRYLNGGWQAYGNLPSWQYEPDTIINGYTYKVMRQVYMSGVFNQLPLIFTIE